MEQEQPSSQVIDSFSARSYYLLTKPGIILGNLITMSGGFFLASRGNINVFLFLITTLGLSLIIASSCVLNNAIDRAADAKMERTKQRALANQTISLKTALFFGLSLGLIGAFILAAFTNRLTFGLALVGFFIYVILYSFSKYYSTHGTLIGSIAGALPPTIGYCAVSNHFDLGATFLFIILTVWQMPHFLAITIRRMQDYIAASIPILPVKKGIIHTKFQMLYYVFAFLGTAPLLSIFGYTGIIYLTGVILMGIAWVILSLQGFFTDNNEKWAKKMFIYSLIVITVLNLLILID